MADRARRHDRLGLTVARWIVGTLAVLLVLAWLAASILTGGWTTGT